MEQAAGKLVDKESGRREAEVGGGNADKNGDVKALLLEEPEDFDGEGCYIFAILSSGDVCATHLCDQRTELFFDTCAARSCASRIRAPRRMPRR